MVNKKAELSGEYSGSSALYVEAIFVSHIPHEVHCAPGESGAECGEDEFVALVKLVLVFVEAQGD